MKTMRVILVMAAISLTCTLYAQKRVAVLIVGDYTGSGVPVQNQWNDGNMGGGTVWDEFWNDTYLLWEYLYSNQLTGGIGYFNDYIYVYFYNGNNFVSQNPNYIVPQNTTFTDAAATTGNVEDLFDGLATGTGGFPQLTSDDFLFIWTMGHGGSTGNNSYMYLMDGTMSDTEFGGLVNNVTAQKKVIWMQQGFAGGFADNFTGNNVIFYSACHANENAHRANNTPYLENELWNNVPYHHGEYDFHTYSPMAGLSPGGDDEYNGVAYTTIRDKTKSI